MVSWMICVGPPGRLGMVCFGLLFRGRVCYGKVRYGVVGVVRLPGPAGGSAVVLREVECWLHALLAGCLAREIGKYQEIHD